MKVIGKETGIQYFEGALHSECTRYIGKTFGINKTFVLFEAEHFESNKINIFNQLEKINGILFDRNRGMGIYYFDSMLEPKDANAMFTKKMRNIQGLVNIKKIQSGIMPEPLMIVPSY